MVVEWVVAKPWTILACVSCGKELSIPALGPSRNLAPVICPYCKDWFAWKTPRVMAVLEEANRLLKWPVLNERLNRWRNGPSSRGPAARGDGS